MNNFKIAPYTSKLHPGNAMWMAQIAKEVYERKSPSDSTPNEDVILANLRQHDEKFISVKGYNRSSAQAALVEHHDYLCMAFRGTDEIADWLDNANAFSTKELFGEFHRGFWNSLSDVWEGINGDYCKLRSKKKRPLFITGHSLGGAMATVAAARLIHEDRPFTSAYTFGQPRVLGRETAQIFNAECKSRYFRFHNNNDIVTRLPARLMGYSHVGSYLYISTEEIISQEPGFWSKFVDSVEGILESVDKKGLDSFEDHGMDNYLRAIEKWDLEI